MIFETAYLSLGPKYLSEIHLFNEMASFILRYTPCENAKIGFLSLEEYFNRQWSNFEDPVLIGYCKIKKDKMIIKTETIGNISDEIIERLLRNVKELVQG